MHASKISVTESHPQPLLKKLLKTQIKKGETTKYTQFTVNSLEYLSNCVYADIFTLYVLF
jgi:NADH:ubiquinone oxidoreductase subunit E